MIYTVTLNPALDYGVGLDTLEPGRINRAFSEGLHFGGKGINVSNVLRTLGFDTVALGFIAGPTGDALEKGLQDMGLKTGFLRVRRGMTRINVKIHAAEETEINGTGPEITPADLEALCLRLDGLTPEDTLVLSGSIPRSLPPDTYGRILSRLGNKGLRTLVDTAGAPLESTLPCRPFLIKPNHHELGALFGRSLTTLEQIVDCARALQDRGARNVLVSRAGDGAVLLEESGCIHHAPCPKGQVVSSVGAGDSMVAGFLAGYLQTGDFAHALRLGTAAGSATAFSPGLADRDAIMSLLAAM